MPVSLAEVSVGVNRIGIISISNGPDGGKMELRVGVILNSIIHLAQGGT